MHSGLVAVAYNLKDVGPDDGGFACVPGSHKSAFAFPDNWKDLSDPHPCVRRVTGPAGSAVIFTEALVHGTLPWRGSEERRTAFYKYSPRTLAWSRTLYEPDHYPDLTQRQSAHPPVSGRRTHGGVTGQSPSVRPCHIHGRRGGRSRSVTPAPSGVGGQTSLECCPLARRESGCGESGERGDPKEQCR